MYGLTARQTRAKMPRPRLNRSDPLVDDSLLFAAAYGWRRGYTDRAAGDFGDRDAQSAYRGFWTLGAGAGQYGAGPQIGAQAGWGCDNGDGVTGDSSQEWIPDPARWMDLPAQAATWAISIRPDVQSVNGQLPFFKRRAQPYGAANAGWCFTGAAGNLWRFNYSNGAAQATATGTTVQDVTGIRTDFLIVTMAPSGANVVVTMYCNGLLEAQIATGTQLANAAATEAVKIFGLGPANERFPGFSDVAYIWGRPLNEVEIKRLSADRFRPFRGGIRARQGMAW